ncbi:MAG: formate--tetrahydrofolate ligase, partial [Pseudomonadales bacterium]|nr:formate--tetrahydrofolate ligase [Pseudomonadales bacterium]
TRTAMKLADYVVTEAGFGSDLGAEKFMNIVCRKGGFKPDAVVIVATIRSLKMNGGVAKNALTVENLDALDRGMANLERHIRNMKGFGLPVVVALNHFVADTQAELKLVMERCAAFGVDVVESKVWAEGGAGGEALAEKVVEIIEKGEASFSYLYEDSLPLWQKVESIAQKIYGADTVQADKKIRDKFQEIQDAGYGNLPVCMAKTQYSFSSDPNLLGAPSGFDLQVRDVRLAAGAEFVIVYCGDIMTLPGLPKVPAAEHIDVDSSGKITGLF